MYGMSCNFTGSCGVHSQKQTTRRLCVWAQDYEMYGNMTFFPPVVFRSSTDLENKYVTSNFKTEGKWMILFWSCFLEETKSPALQV